MSTCPNRRYPTPNRACWLSSDDLPHSSPPSPVLRHANWEVNRATTSSTTAGPSTSYATPCPYPQQVQANIGGSIPKSSQFYQQQPCFAFPQSSYTYPLSAASASSQPPPTPLPSTDSTTTSNALPSELRLATSTRGHRCRTGRSSASRGQSIQRRPCCSAMRLTASSSQNVPLLS